MDNEKSFKGILDNIKSYINNKNIKINKFDSNENNLITKPKQVYLSNGNIDILENSFLSNSKNNDKKLLKNNSLNKINELNTKVLSNKLLNPNFKNYLTKNSKINKDYIMQTWDTDNNIKTKENLNFGFLNRINSNKFKNLKTQIIKLENNKDKNLSNFDDNLEKYNKITFDNKTIFPTNYLNKNNFILNEFYLFKNINPNHLNQKKTLNNKEVKNNTIYSYFLNIYKNKKLKKNKSVIFMKISNNNKYILITDYLNNIIIYELLIDNFLNKGFVVDGQSKFSYIIKFTNNCEIICIDWSADTKFVIVSNSDRSLKIYDINCKNNTKFSFKFDYLICCLGIHPLYPKLIAIGCSDKIFRIIKLKNSKVSTWDQNDNFITSLDFNPSGKMIAVALWKGKIKIYEFKKILIIKKEWNIKTKYIYQIKFINNYQILIRNKENFISLVNIKNSKIEQNYIVPFSQLNNINFDFDYNLIIGINKKNNVIIWNKINDYIPFINPKFKSYNKNINKSIEYFQPFKNNVVKNVCFIPNNLINILNDKISNKKIKFGIICVNLKNELKIFYQLK